MPNLSIYVRDEIYFELAGSTGQPSKKAKEIIEAWYKEASKDE